MFPTVAIDGAEATPVATSASNLKAIMFIPEGYVSVGDAIARLEHAWLEEGKIISPWDAAEAVGVALASKKLRCFGVVDEKGVLIEIPNSHWLTSEGRQIIARPTARITSIGGKSTYGIVPIVPEIDFGEQFPEGRYPNAKPPAIWPEGYKTEGGDLPTLIEGGELASIAPAKNKGGRPVEHDWDAFWIEVVRFVFNHGFEKQDRTACQKHMEDWTAEKWKNPPGESTIRGKLAKLFVAPVTIKT